LGGSVGIALSALDDLVGASSKEKVTTTIPFALPSIIFFNSAVMLISDIPAIGVLEGIDDTSLFLLFCQIVRVARIIFSNSMGRRMEHCAIFAGRSFSWFFA